MTKKQICCSCFIAATVLFGALFSTVSAQISHYRFEDGIPGERMPLGGGVIVDSIGNNNLNVFDGDSGAFAPFFSSNVPASTVPLTGASNNVSAFFTPNQDVFGSTGLYGGAGQSFTIEAFVNFTSLAGWQTIVGRDNAADGTGAGNPAQFYLSKSGLNDAFRVQLNLDNGDFLEVNSSFVAQTNTWYHIAAVGDAGTGTLELFVDGDSVGSTLGYTGMFESTELWSIGRGWFNGPADFMAGYIDEVRFSGHALDESEFLVAIPEPRVYAAVIGGLAFVLVMVRRRFLKTE